jgi:hypothetical protein
VSTRLLLHAITTPPEGPSREAAGLRGNPLTALEVDGLTVWATGLTVDTDSFSRADLLDHHRIVTEVFTRVEACLPARFPTLLDGPRVQDLVGRRYDELQQQLEIVRGACELAVTAVWTTAEDPKSLPVETSPGRRYLLERQRTLSASDRRRARAVELADDLERELADVLLEARRQLCPSASVALSCALLLPVRQAEAARQRIPRSAADVRILVNGPWPPYTFASVNSE